MSTLKSKIFDLSVDNKDKTKKSLKQEQNSAFLGLCAFNIIHSLV